MKWRRNLFDHFGLLYIALVNLLVNLDLKTYYSVMRFCRNYLPYINYRDRYPFVYCWYFEKAG